ncbi:hypothetical protein DL93DRAFT_2093812 [Clavulina sp. PMI_390]|nr:hypothetical protein DL93DRAFT_2093812 [Clavulina sp. PMI_390]
MSDYGIQGTSCVKFGREADATAVIRWDDEYARELEYGPTVWTLAELPPEIEECYEISPKTGVLINGGGSQNIKVAKKTKKSQSSNVILEIQLQTTRMNKSESAKKRHVPYITTGVHKILIHGALDFVCDPLHAKDGEEPCPALEMCPRRVRGPNLTGFGIQQGPTTDRWALLKTDEETIRVRLRTALQAPQDNFGSSPPPPYTPL